MPNSTEHFITGGITSSLIYNATQSNKYVDIKKVLECGLLGGLIASLPDILEPADSPHHRKFFHSISFGLILINLINNLKNNQNIPIETKEVLIPLAAAYGSHLIADLNTQKSLPLL